MCEQLPTQAQAHARALLQKWGEIHTLLGFQLHPWTHPRALRELMPLSLPTFPTEARTLRKSTQVRFFMNFSLEMTQPRDSVGEKFHFVPGARRLEAFSASTR